MKYIKYDEKVNAKRAISLLYLIIIIVILIILAGTVFLFSSNKNTISAAQESKYKLSIRNLSDKADVSLSGQYLKDKTISKKTITDKDEIQKYVPELKGTDFENKVYIANGELIFKGSLMKTEEIEWAREAEVTVDAIPVPSRMAVTPDYEKIDVEIYMPYTDGIVKYKYRIKRLDDTKEGKWVESDSLTHTFTGLSQATKYKIEVVSVAQNGLVSEILSKEVKTLVYKYNITYALNGGTLTHVNPAEYTIESSDITLNDPSKIGYTFTGWTGSNGSIPQTPLVIANGSTGDRLYNANYVTINYAIRYNLNGGNVSPANPSTYNIETNEITLNNPNKTGYTFLGWIEEGKTTTPNISMTIPKGSYGDKKFIAKWDANTYTVKYNANGGTGSMTSSTFTYDDNTKKLSKNTFTRDKYTFIGWSKDKDAKDATYADETIANNLTSDPNGEVTLYAIWANIVISPKPVTLDLSGTKTQQLSVSGNYGEVKSYTSSNTGVATVSSSGLVTALANGTTIITVTGKKGNVTDTCAITVQTSPTGVTLDKTTATLDLSGTKTVDLTATIAPSTVNVSNGLTWETSDSTVASLSATSGGKITVTGKKNGKATITVKTANNKIATCTVTVQTSPISVSLDKTTATIDLGVSSTLDLTATLNPTTSNVSNGLTWTTSDSTVASLSATSGGKITVTGKKNGTATITVKTANNKTATCAITVQTSPTGISINGNAYVGVGKTTTYSVTYTPSTANVNKGITWTSGTTANATIDSNGKITGKAAGTSVITARTANGKSATKTVTVTSLGVSPTSVTLDMSGTKTQKLTVSGSNYGTVTYASSNTGVATVGTDGTITGVANGTCTITATGSNGGPTATCAVTVQTSPTGVTLNKTTATLDLSGTKTVDLTATIAPSTANVSNGLTWTTSDSTVASISATSGGKITVTGKKNGTATITVKTANNKTATCEVTVQTSPTGISINGNAYVGVGKTTTYSVTYTPSTANVNKGITWTSGTTANATINSSGVITGVAAGTSVITARTANGKSATKTVTVTNITLTPSKVTLDLSGTKTAKPTLGGSNYGTITWSSSNTGVATVGTDGTITGVANGTCTITATGANRGPTATCEVTVQTSPTGVTLNKTTATLDLSGTKTVDLTATIAPSTANVSNGLTWTTSDSTVASISATSGGKITVTGNKNGTATITVKTANNKTATCAITVQTSPTSIAITGDPYVGVRKTTTYSVTYTPSTANVNKTITWTSGTTANATINSSGVITGVAAGTSVITARTANGKSATKTVTVTNITLTPSKVTLDLSGTKTAKPTLGGSNYGTITWSSSNTGVATVGTDGTITAVANGTANIVARGSNGNPTATCEVTVQTSATGVTLDKTGLALDLSGTKTYKLTATVAPSTANVGNGLTWSSTNTGVATVGTDGTITAVANGTCNIKVTTANGKSATCSLTVQTSPTSIAITGNTYVGVGKTTTYSVTYTPSTANVNKTITWTSGTTANATINSSGVITGVAAGTSVITARTANGKSATKTVTVTNITLTPSKVTLDLSGTKTAKPTLGGSNYGTITWSSSNTGVATVGTDGTITAVANGTANIVARGSNGNPTATCVVTVQTSPTGVTLDKTGLALDLSGTKTYKLTATVAPSTANVGKGLTWSSTNTGVATVGTDGTITAVANGTCNIKVTTANGKSATCTLTVQTSPTSIAITGNAYVGVGKTTTYSVTYTPSTANANKTITWTSGTTANATVNSSGVVTGVAAGTSVITAKTTNGKTATKTVTVTSLGVSPTSVTLDLSGTKTKKLTLSGSNYGTVTYVSSNTGVATVGTDGTITGVANGTCTITATGANGGPTATCAVTVQTSPTGVSLNKTSATLTSNSKTVALTATIAPSTSNVNNTITWTTSKTSVATVSNGTVTAVANGTCNITATTTNGITATCSITVDITGPTLSSISSQKVISFTNGTSLTLSTSSPDNNAKITYAVVPANCTVSLSESTGAACYYFENLSTETSPTDYIDGTTSFTTGSTAKAIGVQIFNPSSVTSTTAGTVRVTSIKSSSVTYKLANQTTSKLVCCTTTNFASGTISAVQNGMTYTYDNNKGGTGGSTVLSSKSYNATGNTTTDLTAWASKVVAGSSGTGLTGTINVTNALGGLLIKTAYNIVITGAKKSTTTYMISKAPYGYYITIPYASESGSTTKYSISGNKTVSETAITSPQTMYLPVGCTVTVKATDSNGNVTTKTASLT